MPSTKAAGGGIFSGVFNKDVKVPLQEAKLVGTSSSNKNSMENDSIEDWGINEYNIKGSTSRKYFK